MSSEQKVFCQACGREFLTRFKGYDGRVCSRECGEELEWRRTLSILGREYYPRTGLVKFDLLGIETLEKQESQRDAS